MNKFAGKMRIALTYSITGVIYVYFFVLCLIAFPYNWRSYSKGHGIIGSVFVGPLYSMARSFVWPYDAIRGMQNDPHITNKSVLSFYSASKAKASIDELLKNAMNSGSDEEIKSVDAKAVIILNAAISEIDGIDFDYLDTLYPNWGSITRDELKTSYEFYKKGMLNKADDVSFQNANSHFLKFDKWAKENWDKILDKVTEH